MNKFIELGPENNGSAFINWGKIGVEYSEDQFDYFSFLFFFFCAKKSSRRHC